MEQNESEILDVIDKAFSAIRKNIDKVEYAEIENLPENKKKYVREHLLFLSRSFEGVANLYK